MAVRTVTRRGKRKLIIDIPYRDPSGAQQRYRRDSTGATLAAAREEDRRIRNRIAETGSPYEPPTEGESNPAPPVPSFKTVAADFLRSYAPSQLKVSTRLRYKTLLEGLLVPRFGEISVDAVDATAIRTLDAELAEKKSRRGGKLRRSTRNNVQICVRSVLRFAVEAGHLASFPSLPPLKRIGSQILNVMSDEEVDRVLAAARGKHRIAFMLGAYAGLRAGEVRGLRWGDVRLTGKNGSLRGELAVRRATLGGEIDVPKSGRERVVPLVPPLLHALAAMKRGQADDVVATNRNGDPWSDNGLGQAFERVRDRAGLSGWTFHSLRHYFVTSWLRRGVPAHVVQAIAGHENLATTQRYAHVTAGDLEEAVRRVSGNMLVTGFPEGGDGGDRSSPTS